MQLSQHYNMHITQSLFPANFSSKLSPCDRLSLYVDNGNGIFRVSFHVTRRGLPRCRIFCKIFSAAFNALLEFLFETLPSQYFRLTPFKYVLRS